MGALQNVLRWWGCLLGVSSPTVGTRARLPALAPVQFPTPRLAPAYFRPHIPVGKVVATAAAAARLAVEDLAGVTTFEATMNRTAYTLDVVRSSHGTAFEVRRCTGANNAFWVAVEARRNDKSIPGVNLNFILPATSFSLSLGANNTWCHKPGGGANVVGFSHPGHSVSCTFVPVRPSADAAAAQQGGED